MSVTTLWSSSQSSDPENSTFGTGFVIHQDLMDQRSYFLTCAHVVRDLGGKEKACIKGKPAILVAFGDSEGMGVDLAVLCVEELLELPSLTLQTGAQEGDAFSATGFQQFKPSFLLRPINGRLGHKQVLIPEAERNV